MMDLWTRWKEEALELRRQAIQCETPEAARAMTIKADMLVRCANELMRTYLQGE